VPPALDAMTQAEAARPTRKAAGRLLRGLLPYAGLIALSVALFLLTDRFLTAENLSDVARRVSIINIIAVGMTFVILTGGIDLSVGSIVAVAGVAGTWGLTLGLPVPAGIALGIAMGALCGLANGSLVAWMRLPPFIATLGTMGALRGLALYVTDGRTITEGVPRELGRLADGRFLGVPFPVWILVPLAILAHLVLVRTRFGRYCYAQGGNPQAAFLAGIPTRLVVASVYVISGACAGLAGMIDSARILSGNPSGGQEYELRVIAAVVIGGASLTGGRGTIMGATIGALLMAVLENGCNLLGISPFIQRIVIGFLIIAVVAIDMLRREKD
jgi:ribose transport system permease protein